MARRPRPGAPARPPAGHRAVSAADPATLELDPASGTLLAARREWAGRLVTTYASRSPGPQMVTVRTAAAPAPITTTGATANRDRRLAEVAWPRRPVAVVAAARGRGAGRPGARPRAAPKSRRPWSSAGRCGRRAASSSAGAVSAAPAGLARVQQLAAALGGEWAATGGAVDAGWAPPEREIGLYGHQRAPRPLYRLRRQRQPGPRRRHAAGAHHRRRQHRPPGAHLPLGALRIVADSSALLDPLLGAPRALGRSQVWTRNG